MSHETPANPDDLEPSAEAAPADEPAAREDAQAPEPRSNDEAGPGKGAGRGLLHAVGLLALALSIFAAGTAGALWWQYRQFYVALSEADADSAESLTRTRAELRDLADRLDRLGAAGERTRALADQNEDRIESLPARFLDLEERLTAVQGVSQDARRRWLRAEAEYYLTLANAELQLAGHWENAMSALALADGKLLELANPAFSGVRERIEGEIQALESARLPDVEGLSYSLGRLAARVEELPVRSELPGSYRASAEGDQALEDAQPGLGRLWRSFTEALGGMVRVERRDRSIERSLSEEERNLVRRQLALELDTARLALVRTQPEVFRQSLIAANDLLSRDFQTTDASVESAMALLEDMLALDIAPPRPDISGSLGLLRNLPAGGN